MEALFKREEKLFLLVGSCFIALLVVSNIIAVKVISIGGLIGPAAVICYGLTFLLTDTIAEIWGKERTRFLVLAGFCASILAAFMIKMAILFPPAPFWNNQGEYNMILGSNLRIVAASMTAYLISQYHDIWAFHFWKVKTGGKHLWLRNNLSTSTSQLLDTIVFIVIAFYGTGIPILPMILGQYLMKLFIAFLDTPLVYMLVYIIKKNVSEANYEAPAVKA
ncbi:MAG: queuosine precursor transporter [Bacillota bacterium]